MRRCPARLREGPRTTKGPMPVTPRIAADEARDIPPASTPQERSRNFCIIAHIDQGKSTLADRMLQLTGVVDELAMRAQCLDRGDIERVRGVARQAEAVR